MEAEAGQGGPVARACTYPWRDACPNGRLSLVRARGIDPVDAEPATITDFNGFVGLAYISGTVAQTNPATGEVRRLPFVNNDMRFMKGVFRGTDGQIHQGAFALV